MSEGIPERVKDYPAITNDEKNWAMLCHLAALLTLGAPVAVHIVAPTVIWMLERDKHPFVDEHGKESINFQISISIYSFVLICTCIGIPLLAAVWVFNVVMVIIAAIKASSGEPYRYPLCIRFLK